MQSVVLSKKSLKANLANERGMVDKISTKESPKDVHTVLRIVRPSVPKVAEVETSYWNV